MKIVWVDGYARETMSERLVCSGIENVVEGAVMVQALQLTCESEPSNWYVLQPDDYKLYVFDPT